jgi:glycosyltransferase involved in cell wall biosynthesis
MLLNQSIICFGGEDWWYHHPHSKAHLMRNFARAGNKIIFVNSISMGLPNLAHKDLVPRIRRKLGSYSKLARETDEGITVVSPASLPFFGSAAARTFNRRVISAQLNRLARSRGLEKPILWIAIPTAAEMIGTFDEVAVVYQVSDKYDANTMDHATDPLLIRRLHEQAIDDADLVFYSGRKLFSEATRGCERSYLLEQGVDYDHWRRVGDGTLAVAAEVAGIPRPRIGYFGAIEPWLVDQELIKRAARQRPEWQWIFIGNKSRGLEIEELANTHFLPPVAYADLPNYAAGFDVCVLPWETEQSFTSYGSAIKVREYLATGKPVVIAPLPEYESMSNVLRIGRTREEFLRLVEEALREDDPEARKRRQAAVASGTWEARAELVSSLIEKVLVNRDKNQ